MGGVFEALHAASSICRLLPMPAIEAENSQAQDDPEASASFRQRLQ